MEGVVRVFLIAERVGLALRQGQDLLGAGGQLSALFGKVGRQLVGALERRHQRGVGEALAQHRAEASELSAAPGGM